MLSRRLEHYFSPGSKTRLSDLADLFKSWLKSQQEKEAAFSESELIDRRIINC